MKSLLIVSTLLLTLHLKGQENNSWRFGLQWGFQGNHSVPVNGSDAANAKFHHNRFGGAAFSLHARYDFDTHWMLTTGLGVQSFGFEFALAQNYSLLKEESHYKKLRSEFSALEVPFMVHYKFNRNCRNSGWVIGAGFAELLVGPQSTAKNYTEDTEGHNSGTNMVIASETRNVGCMLLRLVISREKHFKKGGVLNAGIIFNAGLKEIATARVNYSLDGTEYQHEFSNNGNFVGFRLSYYFRPFKTD